jgi:predicted Fe-S protein YdhL (DUF1289 family)
VSANIESPCVGVCTVDPIKRRCHGCLRTLAEIAAWARMTPDERVRIIAELGVRRLQH